MTLLDSKTGQPPSQSNSGCFKVRVHIALFLGRKALRGRLVHENNILTTTAVC